MRELDHLVVACTDLGSGADWLAARLGCAPDPGGAHPAMGTHNRLLRLGPQDYLELIAIDPDAPPPGRPRWFGLDGFAGTPRLVAWVARDGAAPAPAGTEWAEMSRGDLRWRITLPTTAAMPADGAAPLLIDWPAGVHPCQRLPDRGLRLAGLDLTLPDPAQVASPDPRITARPGAPGLRARIALTDGREVIL